MGTEETSGSGVAEVVRGGWYCHKDSQEYIFIYKGKDVHKGSWIVNWFYPSRHEVWSENMITNILGKEIPNPYDTKSPCEFEFKFEQIDRNHQRTKVIGGWLVKAIEDVCHNLTDQGLKEGWDWRIALAFVPDPKHEWIITKGGKD